MNIWGDIICGAFIYIVLPLMSAGCFIGAFILWFDARDKRHARGGA